MPMHNLIEYSDNRSKTSEILWKFYREVPALDDNDAIVDFNAANATTTSLNLKVKVRGDTGSNGIQNVELIARFKYLSNFQRTHEIPLINCDFNLDLN